MNPPSPPQYRCGLAFKGEITLEPICCKGQQRLVAGRRVLTRHSALQSTLSAHLETRSKKKKKVEKITPRGTRGLDPSSISHPNLNFGEQSNFHVNSAAAPAGFDCHVMLLFSARQAVGAICTWMPDNEHASEVFASSESAKHQN